MEEIIVFIGDPNNYPDWNKNNYIPAIYNWDSNTLDKTTPNDNIAIYLTGDFVYNLLIEDKISNWFYKICNLEEDQWEMSCPSLESAVKYLEDLPSDTPFFLVYKSI